MDFVVRKDAPLQRLNSLAVPSLAGQLVELIDRSQIPAMLDWRARQTQPLVVLGEGSNLVLGERIDLPLVLNRLKGKKVISEQGDEVLLQVAAGENWHDLVTWCVNRSYHGLENLALIPGTVGAAPVQNIGAYGVELQQFVDGVEYLDFDSGELTWLLPQQCGFAYRDSVFKGELRDRGMIVSLRLRLGKTPQTRVDYPTLRETLDNPDRATPRQVYDAVVAVRRSRLPDPQVVPNVGSFFHNPVVSKLQYEQLRGRHPDLPCWSAERGQVKLAAAWLIEQQGWKGREVQGVKVSPDHALVLINPNRRPATDVLALAGQIRDSVMNAYGVQLTIEPRLVGISV